MARSTRSAESALFAGRVGTCALFGFAELASLIAFQRGRGALTHFRYFVPVPPHKLCLIAAEFARSGVVPLTENFLALPANPLRSRLPGRCPPGSALLGNSLPGRSFSGRRLSRARNLLAAGLPFRSRFRRFAAPRNLLRFRASSALRLCSFRPALRLAPFGWSSLHFALRAGNLREQRLALANVPLCHARECEAK